ncbi:hypothetical protein VTL71DRAFT_12979, partial [Oculimacula yallundae]
MVEVKSDSQNVALGGGSVRTRYRDAAGPASLVLHARHTNTALPARSSDQTSSDVVRRRGAKVARRKHAFDVQQNLAFLWRLLLTKTRQSECEE